MKKILLFTLVAILFAACSKESLHSIYEVSVNDGEIISTKSSLFCDSTAIHSTTYLGDTYWENNGITPEFLKTIEGGDNKMNKCQIPEKILKTIPSMELALICLTHPLNLDFLLSNDEDYAIDFMITNFNVLSELLNREDGPLCLIKSYASINKENVYYQLIEAFAENLLKNDKFYEKMDMESIDLLRSVIVNKINNRKLKKNGLIPQHRINNLHSKLFGYDLISKASNTTNDNDEVLNSVITPFGKTVPFTIFPEMEQDSIDYITNWYVSRYNVEILEPATQKYNCHAYAWASSKLVWINDPVAYYTTNDLYFRSNSNVAIVVYGGDHSAVKQSNSYYISKWYNGPLVRHSPTNVPSIYQPNNRTNYSLPYIQGPDVVNTGSTYTYTMEPNMSYAMYTWSIPDQEEDRYEFLNQSNNTIQIKFRRGGVYLVYCSISNAHGEVVHTDRYEVLVN